MVVLWLFNHMHVFIFLLFDLKTKHFNFQFARVCRKVSVLSKRDPFQDQSKAKMLFLNFFLYPSLLVETLMSFPIHHHNWNFGPVVLIYTMLKENPIPFSFSRRLYTFNGFNFCQSSFEMKKNHYYYGVIVYIYYYCFLLTSFCI